MSFFLTALSLLTLTALRTSVGALNTADLEALSQHLVIRYHVTGNLGLEAEVRLSLTNNASSELPAGGWILHFSHVRMLNPRDLLDSDGLPRPEGVLVANGRLLLNHVTGSLFSLTPQPELPPFIPGATIDVALRAQYWVVSRTDVMPRFYVTAGADGPSLDVQSTETLDFVDTFDEAAQYRRSPDDRYAPYSPQQRFQKYLPQNLADSDGSDAWRIVPSVKQTNLSSELLQIGTWVIYSSDASADAAAHFLSGESELPVVDTEPSSSVIRFVKSRSEQKDDGQQDDEQKDDEQKDDEKYVITVSRDTESMTVLGTTSASFVRAAATIAGWMAVNSSVPVGSVTDSPHFRWRGLHLDVARNFRSHDHVIKILRQMARYKLNVLHLHLTDDEGWRLEIPSLPELTQFSGKRCANRSVCLDPQLGSGSLESNSGSGYYSVPQYRQILRAAANLSIEVVPEVDMPGHAEAAVRAMIRRSESGVTPEYRLDDPLDASRYLSEQMYTGNAINPCVSGPAAFVETVFGDIQAMHADIKPLKFIHIGGDEVAPQAWSDSPACESKYVNVSRTDVKRDFLQQVVGVAARLRLDVVGWADAFFGTADEPFARDLLPPERAVVAQAWSNVWEWGDGGRAYRLANAGYQAVLSHVTHFYFDHPDEPSPDRRGFYWGTRYTDAEKTFTYRVSDVYANIDVSRFGDALDRDTICRQGGCPALEKPENLIGIQAQLWSETVRSDEQSDEMLFPRLLAFAERAWHLPDWAAQGGSGAAAAVTRDWRTFAGRVGRVELARLDGADVAYALRAPGVRLTDGQLHVLSEFPSQSIQYRRVAAGKNSPAFAWRPLSGPLDHERGVEYSFRVSTPSRHGPVTTVNDEILVPGSSAPPETCPLAVAVLTCIVMLNNRA